MKQFLKIFGLIFFFCINCVSAKSRLIKDSTCRIEYLHTILADTGSFNPWIVIKIGDSRKQRLIIVENYELYNYLRTNYDISFEKYRSKIFDVLKNKKVLTLSKGVPNNYFIDIDASTITTYKSVRDNGIESLLQEYLNESRNSNSILLSGLDIFFDYCYIIQRSDFTPGFTIKKFQCNSKSLNK